MRKNHNIKKRTIRLTYLDKLPESAKRPPKYDAINFDAVGTVLNFSESNARVCVVSNEDTKRYSNIAVCYNALMLAIKHNRITGVRALIGHDCRIYLVKVKSNED